jgi:periplasmic divalent cation tolerance protein
MEGTGYLVVLVTASSGDEARRIADLLLEHRKAACISIVPGVSSLFWWRGKIDSAEESLLIIKTRPSRLDDIIGLVRQVHSYEVPEIIALPVIGGNQDYLEWLDKEVD